MKALFTTAMLAVAMTLTACGGGSSDSSGHQPNQQDKPNNAQSDQSVNKNACQVNGNSVYVTSSGCTFSHPQINKGEDLKYVCQNGKVSNGFTTGQKVTLQGYTFVCKS